MELFIYLLGVSGGCFDRRSGPGAGCGGAFSQISRAGALGCPLVIVWTDGRMDCMFSLRLSRCCRRSRMELGMRSDAQHLARVCGIFVDNVVDTLSI